MKQSFWSRFFIRWAVSGLGLWIAAAILGSERLSVGGRWGAYIAAGLFLALVNMFLKPLLVFLSIPAILISLGLFMLVVNGFLIIIVSWIYDPLYVKNLGVAVVAGLIIGLVNYLVSQIVEDFGSKK